MITTIVDHSNHYRSARNQGVRPTCLAFAVSDINAFHHNSEELSIDYLCHHAAKDTPGWAGEGFALDVMFSAVSNEGQPFEHLYPYCLDDSLTPLIIPPTGLNPIFKADVKSEAYTFDEIINKIDNGKTVGIAIAVTPSLYQPRDGVVAHDVNALVDTYHALIATGYGVNRSTTEKYIKVRNSWGSGWGLEGYAWLPQSLVDLHLMGTFII